MRYSGIVFLIFAILLAGSATWLHNLWRQNEMIIKQLDTSRIDYYLSDFSLFVTDATGNNRFSISGEHFVHQRKTEVSDIYKPRIIANYNAERLTLVANRARQHANKDIELQDEVEIQKPESKELMGFDMKTADIVYSPKLQTIESDAEVYIKTSEGHMIEAQGFSEDLKTQTLRLKSNVHAEYMPPLAE